MKNLLRLAIFAPCWLALTAFPPDVTRAEVPEELLTSPLAELFGMPPAIGRPRISPDGTSVLYLTQDQGGLSIVAVFDSETRESTTVGNGSLDGYEVEWCEWVNETRLLCDMVFAVNADGTDLLRVDSGRAISQVPEAGTNCISFSGTPTSERAIDVLPWDPENVVGCALQNSVNVYTGRSEAYPNGPNASDSGQIFSDGRGFARFRRDRNLNRSYDRWYMRETVDSDWVLFHESDPTELENPFRPVGFGADTSLLFHLAADSTRWGLHAMALAGDFQSGLVYEHERFDIEHVDLMGPFGRVVAAAWLDGRPQRFVVDQRVAEVYDIAETLFPGQNIEVVDESWDGNFYIVLAREPRRAGVYFRLDVWNREILALGSEYPELDDYDLAPTQTVTFDAADGGTITGHLTLPTDRVTPLSAVIIPRAVPSEFDIDDPHFLVQFLAASGHAVLRLNYRSEEKYGAWLVGRTGISWRLAVSDLDDSVRFLRDQVTSESADVCAMGYDIGSHISLMYAIEHPGNLACVIGVASTFGPAVEDINFVHGREGVQIAQDAIISRGVDRITEPVLLFHARQDGIVSLRPSEEIATNLRRNDRQVEFIEYLYTRHYIERRDYRTDMLTRIGTFLAEHIGD